MNKPIQLKIPTQASRALLQFMHEHTTLLGLASERQRDTEKVMENFQLQSAALREKWAEGDFTASPLPKKHDVDAVRPGMLAEMTFVRLVDNYMIFLQDILALIYSADPKKAGKIRVDIGEWPNLTAETDIFSAMRGLAIASISETTRTTLFDAFKKLGITTVTLQRSRHELSEALDIRDQIVHRRGLWGNFKGDEFPSTRRFRENWSCGKTVREFEKKNGHLEQFIWDSVTAIDDEAIKCYSLESFAVPNSKPRG